MTTCELWIKGTAEYYGPYPIDELLNASWPIGDPIPVATNLTNAGDWNFWTDQYGGNFLGAGWRSTPITYLKNCIQINQPFDCINGGCVPKSTYNTPGVFPNLAACESGCAKNSNCTGECIDPAEIAAHQQAINNLKAKIC